jgi:hypothetical protein
VVICLLAPVAVLLAATYTEFEDLVTLDSCLTILWLGLWL